MLSTENRSPRGKRNLSPTVENTPVTPSGDPSTAAPEKAAQTKPASKARRGNTPWESDEELVKAILGGSREHFDMLYDTYFPRVYRFALKRLRDPGEAEDVTQEVFLTVYRALDSWAGNSSLLVWIFGITRNKVNRRFRGTRPRFESIDGEAATEIAAAESPTDRTVEARRILAHCEEVIASELTPLQRRIFHMKHLRRQSIRAIAGALGKSEDAIKANLYRMRRTIAQAAPGLETLLSA